MAHQLLLADDSVTIQRVIKLTFADEDVEVQTVGDGDLAVASIDKQPPDIVLADVAMPGRSGYEVAQHVRTSPRLSHIPVLLLTGAFEPVDEARAAEAGCDGVLAKPFEPEVVVAKVKELLARPRTGVKQGPAASAAAATLASAPAAPLVFPVKEAVVATGPATPDVAAAMAHPFDVASAATVPVGQAPSDVDAYFERLDQAFATLATSPRPVAPAGTAVAPAPLAVDAAVAGPMPQLLDDAFSGLSKASSDTVAQTAAAASPVAMAPPVAAASTVAVPAASAPVLTAVPVPAAGVAQAALSDEHIEKIVSRVIERLTERLGANLSNVVAEVAERLVKEEIAQIKRRV